MDPQVIYKVCSRKMWDKAVSKGVFDGAAIDVADGFIHFSSAEQVEETVAKHFAGQADLVLVSVPSESLGANLKWEVSRGGALFPHLYGALNVADAVRVDDLPLDDDGAHRFPSDVSR